MLDFQFIEEGLRRYIATVYEVIRHRLGADIPFKFAEDDLDKDSLGKLLYKFGKLTDNAALVDQLRKLAPERNACVHRGLLVTIGPGEDPAQLDKLTSDMEGLRQVTVQCVRDVLAEGKKVEALRRVATG